MAGWSKLGRRHQEENESKLENPYRAQSRVDPPNAWEDREAGRREIVNDVFHALIRAGLSGGEYSVVLTIIDRTWGFQRGSFRVSLFHFQEVSGLSRQGVIDAVHNLEDKRLIFTQRKGTRGTEYLFNKHYDTWKTPPASQVELTSKDASWSSRVDQSSKVELASIGQAELTSTSQVPEPDTEPVKKRIKESIKVTSKERVLALWKKLNLIEQTGPTDERSQALDAVLTEHSVEEVCQWSIDYAEVLRDQGRFSDLQWSLEELLSLGKPLPSKSLRKESHPPGDPLLAELSTLYEKKIGQLTPRLAEEFVEFCSGFDRPVSWIGDAFEEALSRKKRNWHYIRAILENWQEGGKPDAKVTRQPQKRRRTITYIKGAGEGSEREG